MRVAIWLLALVALAAADPWEEPWVEEEELEEPYDKEQAEIHDSDRRPRLQRQVYADELHDIYEEDPYEEHVRVRRRCCDEPYRVRRSADYVRVPRQVHQYEVHEFTDESSLPSPPYEEMLAASAEHYHRIYATPGAPVNTHYESREGVSSQPLGVRPVPSITQFVPVGLKPGPMPKPVAIVEPPPKFSSVSQNHAPLNHAPPQTLLPQIPVQAHPVPVNHNPSVVSSPVEYVELPNAAPVPVTVVSAVPAPVLSEPVSPVVRLAEGDLLGSAAGHAHQHHHHRARAHGHSAGGGHAKHADRHAAHGGKSVKGFSSHQDTSKGSKGHKTDEHHRKEHEEAAGNKKKHHDHAEHKGGHEEEAHGHRGAHFDEKKGHKKGHKTKGYHNKYHKDEFHKEHKFYDDFHKSGEHHRYGKFHAKHASNESGKKKAHHVNAGHDYVERGKKGYSNKGHLDADHKGHKSKHGHEEHHENHQNHGKKGGSEGGKEWGYSKKN